VASFLAFAGEFGDDGIFPMLSQLSYMAPSHGRIRTCDLRINEVTLVFTTGETIGCTPRFAGERTMR